MGAALKGRSKGHRRRRDSLGHFVRLDPAKMHQNAHVHVALSISNTTSYPATAWCHKSWRTEHARGARRAAIGGMWFPFAQPRCATAGRLTSCRALSRRAAEGGAAHQPPSGRGRAPQRVGERWVRAARTETSRAAPPTSWARRGGLPARPCKKIGRREAFVRAGGVLA